MQDLARIRAFVQVVEAQGFSAAARLHGRSKALLSKYVTDLENHLDVRLLNRTTRKLSLTEAGDSYFQEVREILQRLEELDNSISEQSSVPQGVLCISAPRNYGEAKLAGACYEFAKLYPQISLDLRFEDRKVDLVAEGVDVALRMWDRPDSALIARSIGHTNLVLCASPEFIASQDPLERPEQLRTRECIIDANWTTPNGWTFDMPNGPMTVQVSGRIRVNSPHAAGSATAAGLGYGIMPSYIAAPYLESGELVRLFPDEYFPEISFQAVYPHRQHLPVKVRVFIDFIAKWFVDHPVG